MNALNEIKTVLGEKRGKKLAALYVGVFLLIVAVVFFATFKLCENIHLKQMNNYLADFRRMIESSESELHARSRIYEQDILTRAALGVKICAEESAPAEGDELERIREAVSASSVSLLDGQRQLISSTGPKCPEEIFFDCLKNLETGKAYTEIYPATDADGKNTNLPHTPGPGTRWKASCWTTLRPRRPLRSGRN